tara:strand:- start:2041 stop:2532 length:492 start_codon:yes stop_codon:yes gene_type:complete
MKKIFNIAFLIFIFISLNECTGYKPIFGSSNLKFQIEEYEVEGDRKLGNKLYAKLHSLSKSSKNEIDVRSLNIFINVNQIKNPTTKDSSGKILEYKIDLTTKIEIIDSINNSIVLKKDFNSSLNYKVQSQYSNTIKLENQTIEDLINKTYQEILVDLSKNIIL